MTFVCYVVSHVIIGYCCYCIKYSGLIVHFAILCDKVGQARQHFLEFLRKLNMMGKC